MIQVDKKRDLVLRKKGKQARPMVNRRDEGSEGACNRPTVTCLAQDSPGQAMDRGNERLLLVWDALSKSNDAREPL